MNRDDLDEYIKANSKAYDIFIIKARADQKRKNANRKMSLRFTEDKIEREAQKDWDKIVNNLYEKLNSEKKLKKKAPIYWVNFILENDLLENLEESMAELDLEAE